MKTALVLCTTLVAGVACAAIDANAAAQAALKQAGLTAVAPNALYVEPDRDDGRWVYEVKFHDGVSAYDCKIDATTGAVLKIERETLEQIPGVAAPKATQPVAQPAATPVAPVAPAARPGLPAGLLSEAQAKTIALADARLSEADVKRRGYKAKLDTEHGIQVWEIEFRAGDKEYDYEIDAKTGAIRAREIETKRGLFD